MDTMTKEQRRKCMQSIHSKDTRPEMVVRKFLFSHGYRYRLHVKTLPGHPDIVMRRWRTVILVNGCFWHGHTDCPMFRMPRTNVDFWKAKIERNRLRDMRDRLALRDMGWHVITLWECQLKPKVREENLVNGEYHVECQNISAKLRDNSLKIKRCHVDLKKEFSDAELQG